MRTKSDLVYYKSRKEAEKAVRQRAKKKLARNYEKILIDDLPEKAMRHLAPDPDKVISTEEMIEMITVAKKERYVFFKNVSGMDHLFQIGMEYLAYITDEDEILEVVADNGERVMCMWERFSDVKETETANEAYGSVSNLA
jgi:hypothetical protein